VGVGGVIGKKVVVYLYFGGTQRRELMEWCHMWVAGLSVCGCGRIWVM